MLAATTPGGSSRPLTARTDGSSWAMPPPRLR